MIIITFYFLMHPGEYTDEDHRNTHPFWCMGIQLSIGQCVLSLLEVTRSPLSQARVISLTFITQKNTVDNKVIQLFWSGNLTCV